MDIIILVSNSAKKKAEEHITEKPSKIIHLALKNHVEAMDTLTVRDINYIRNNVYYKQKKMQPSLPTSAEETIRVLQNLECKTIKGEIFLTGVEQEKQIIVFSCETNLRVLCNCDTIYLDGTFNYCLNYFFQLFTLHTFINGHYIPLVFSILRSKSTSVYIDTFQFIKKKCREVDLDFNPKFIVVDFEKSIHNAIEFVWPMVMIIGC